jgi:hypothetical protein
MDAAGKSRNTSNTVVVTTDPVEVLEQVMKTARVRTPTAGTLTATMTLVQ